MGSSLRLRLDRVARAPGSDIIAPLQGAESFRTRSRGGTTCATKTVRLTKLDSSLLVQHDADGLVEVCGVKLELLRLVALRGELERELAHVERREHGDAARVRPVP